MFGKKKSSAPSQALRSSAKATTLLIALLIFAFALSHKVEAEIGAYQCNGTNSLSGTDYIYDGKCVAQNPSYIQPAPVFPSNFGNKDYPDSTIYFCDNFTTSCLSSGNQWISNDGNTIDYSKPYTVLASYSWFNQPTAGVVFGCSDVTDNYSVYASSHYIPFFPFEAMEAYSATWSDLNQQGYWQPTMSSLIQTHCPAGFWLSGDPNSYGIFMVQIVPYDTRTATTTMEINWTQPVIIAGFWTAIGSMVIIMWLFKKRI